MQATNLRIAISRPPKRDPPGPNPLTQASTWTHQASKSPLRFLFSQRNGCATGLNSTELRKEEITATFLSSKTMTKLPRKVVYRTICQASKKSLLVQRPNTCRVDLQQPTSGKNPRCRLRLHNAISHLATPAKLLKLRHLRLCPRLWLVKMVK